MDSSDLKAAQALELHDRIAPTLDYLNKLLTRMQRRGFSHDDALWQKTLDGRRAILELVTELRYVILQAKTKAAEPPRNSRQAAPTPPPPLA